MPDSIPLRCDGCGQKASSEHVARRLRRLEWATRYRPVHIQALLLGAYAPREDNDFLYSPNGVFGGEAAALLKAVEISPAGKAAETVLAEFQRAGYFLAHILECPIEPLEEDGQSRGADSARLLRESLPVLATRIRRSLKPKCVMLVTEVPESVVEDILALDLGCPVVLDDGKPFALGEAAGNRVLSRFRERVTAARKG